MKLQHAHLSLLYQLILVKHFKSPMSLVSKQASCGGDVLALLNFYSPPVDEVRPFFKVTDTSGAGKKNYSHNPIEVIIRDLRGQEQDFLLSRHSFAAVSGIQVNDLDYSNEAAPHEHFCQLAGSIIRQKLPDYKKMVVFDVTYRKASRNGVLCRPVRPIHVDQSPSGAAHRIKRHLSEYKANLIENRKIRVRIINVWKPLAELVNDHSLAFTDSLTLLNEDPIPVEHIYSNRTGKTCAVAYNPGQKFWYWSNMMKNKALLLHCYDSLDKDLNSASNVGARCAHGSISKSSGQEGCDNHSVEIRCLVLG